MRDLLFRNSDFTVINSLKLNPLFAEPKNTINLQEDSFEKGKEK